MVSNRVEKGPLMPDPEGLLRDGSYARSFTDLRVTMVEEQLRTRGIRDERVLEAMARVPREEFVPRAFREAAYEDTPLPIGHGQTISQPYTVAFQCEALGLTAEGRVLEIGTGSGYGAAVLSLLAWEVHSIERIPSLAAEARARLERLGYENVQVAVGDGTLGLADEAPFDGIVVTAGGEDVPRAFLDQLAEGGRLVMPVGARGNGQTLYRFTRAHGRIRVEDLGGFVFVPLVGRCGAVEGPVERDAW